MRNTSYLTPPMYSRSNPTNEIILTTGLGAAQPADNKTKDVCTLQYEQNFTMRQSHRGFNKPTPKCTRALSGRKREQHLYLLAAVTRTPCTLNVWNAMRRGSRDHQVLLLHLEPAEQRFSSPITQRAEMPLAAAEPKDISSVHFKGALDYVHAQTILRGSFEGKLTAEPLVATQCMCVCLLNPFFSLPLPLCCGIGRGFLFQKLNCKQNWKSFSAEVQTPRWGIQTRGSKTLKQGKSSNHCSRVVLLPYVYQ